MRLLEFKEPTQEEPRPVNPLAWDIYDLLKNNKMVVWNPKSMPGTTVYIRSVEPVNSGRFDKELGFVGPAVLKCTYVRGLTVEQYLRYRAAKKAVHGSWKTHEMKVKPGTELEWAVQPAFHIAPNVYELDNLE